MSGSHGAVILADPPWKYRAWGKSQGSRTAASFYPTLTVAEICAHRAVVDEHIRGRNAALFLWATPPCIPEALVVLDAWGFDYRTFAFVWVKVTKSGAPATGMGHYTRANAEPCLLGLRGRMSVADHSINQIIRAPRREHSRKPDAIYTRIERLYPDARKLEMYARPPTPAGWDVWGNEATPTPPEAAA